MSSFIFFSLGFSLFSSLCLRLCEDEECFSLCLDDEDETEVEECFSLCSDFECLSLEEECFFLCSEDDGFSLFPEDDDAL